MLNMRTKDYVRKSQCRMLPVANFVMDVMNDHASDHQVSIADEEIGQLPTKPELVDQVAVHKPAYVPPFLATEEEAMIVDDDGADTGVPELGYFEDDDHSESDETVNNPEAGNMFDNLDQNLEELHRILEESDDSLEPKDDGGVPLRLRSMAGKKNLDSVYEWSLMNLSVGAAIRGFGEITKHEIK
jgi:hypothetical protein